MIDLNILDILVPIISILLAIIYLPMTILLLLKDRKFSHLTSWSAFQRAWFSNFWLFFGWATRPLFALDAEAVLSAARGVVLDIGTGSGDWLYMFSPEHNNNISKLYLVEPNSDFHIDLHRKVHALGLAEKCEIINGEVNELEDLGVEPESIDTICTIHVLCSVKNPELLIRTLYQYLKPGGQWLVYEHVRSRNRGSIPAIVQAGFNAVWPFFLDGCSMTRDTEESLLLGGKWTAANLRAGSDEGYFNQLPHIVGALVK